MAIIDNPTDVFTDSFTDDFTSYMELTTYSLQQSPTFLCPFNTMADDRHYVRPVVPTRQSTIVVFEEHCKVRPVKRNRCERCSFGLFRPFSVPFVRRDALLCLSSHALC